MFPSIFNNMVFSKYVEPSDILHSIILFTLLIYLQFFIDKAEIKCSPCLVQMIKMGCINAV